MAKQVNSWRPVWHEDGWELLLKKKGEYVTLYIKRSDKNFQTYSGRLSPHGFEMMFKRAK